MKSRIKRFGPVSYFRVKEKKSGKNFISVWLTGHDNEEWGWEWGTDGDDGNPSFILRLAHFNIFSYEEFHSGYMIYLLGFWIMQ